MRYFISHIQIKPQQWGFCFILLPELLVLVIYLFKKMESLFELDPIVQNESVNSKLSHWNIHKAMNDRVFNIENFKQRLNIIDRLLYDHETCKLPTQAFKDAVELVYKELNSQYDIWEDKVISIRYDGKLIATFTDSEFGHH